MHHKYTILSISCFLLFVLAAFYFIHLNRIKHSSNQTSLINRCSQVTTTSTAYSASYSIDNDTSHSYYLFAHEAAVIDTYDKAISFQSGKYMPGGEEVFTSLLSSLQFQDPQHSGSPSIQSYYPRLVYAWGWGVLI